MSCYEQISSWIENDWGTVTKRFRISSTYDDLFQDSSLCLPVSCFVLDNTSKDLQLKKGALAQHELSFEFSDASKKLPADGPAINLVKSSRVAANIVYVASFIDTPDIPDINDADFIGIIQPEEEANDLRWHGGVFGANPNPLRVWSVRARPFADAILDRISMEEIILGSTADAHVPAISSAWESVYVGDGPGYFSKLGSPQPDRVMIRGLVSLDALLDVLRANYKTGLFNRFNLDLDFEFIRSELSGRWHPTRWNHWEPLARWDAGKHPRWVKSPVKNQPYTIYNDDWQTVAIDPENLQSGDPKGKFYINYDLCKEINLTGKTAEPDPSSAKQFRFTKIKTFFEFLQKLAISVGCTLDLQFVENNKISIRFVSVSQFVKTEIFIKTSKSGKLKGKSSYLYPEQNPVYASRSGYAALDGLDVYYKNTIAGTVNIDPSDKYVKRDSNSLDLLLTVSQTLCCLVESTDNGVYQGSCYIPANTYWTDNNGSLVDYHTRMSVVMTNALYLYCDKYTSHPNATDYEALHYYTPVGALSVSCNGIDKTFTSMSDYYNFINQDFLETFDVDYELAVPGWYCFSSVSDGSAPLWNILLGNRLILDGIDYTIIGIRREYKEPVVIIKLSGTARFNFDIPDTITQIEELFTQRNFNNPDLINLTAGETIDFGKFVMKDSNEKIVVATEAVTNYGKVIGYALSDAESGEDVLVRREGIQLFPDAEFTVGANIFLNTMVTANINYSLDPSSHSSPKIYCIVAVAETSESARIISNPEVYIV